MSPLSACPTVTSAGYGASWNGRSSSANVSWSVRSRCQRSPSLRGGPRTGHHGLRAAEHQFQAVVGEPQGQHVGQAPGPRVVTSDRSARSIHWVRSHPYTAGGQQHAFGVQHVVRGGADEPAGRPAAHLGPAVPAQHGQRGPGEQRPAGGDHRPLRPAGRVSQSATASAARGVSYGSAVVVRTGCAMPGSGKRLRPGARADGVMIPPAEEPCGAAVSGGAPDGAEASSAEGGDWCRDCRRRGSWKRLGRRRHGRGGRGVVDGSSNSRGDGDGPAGLDQVRVGQRLAVGLRSSRVRGDHVERGLVLARTASPPEDNLHRSRLLGLAVRITGLPGQSHNAKQPLSRCSDV